MKCFCCDADDHEANMTRIDFLGGVKFICDECEELARRGRKSMPRVECARPWVLAMDRKRAVADSPVVSK